MRGKSAAFPPPCLNICQLHSITALGVVINDKLTAADHVSSLLTSCLSLLYAMRVLRDHGLPARSLQDVFHATVMAKLTYCAPAWSCLCSHVLQPLLPDKTNFGYNLHSQHHKGQLIRKTARVNNSNFIIRMLYSNLY